MDDLVAPFLESVKMLLLIFGSGTLRLQGFELGLDLFKFVLGLLELDLDLFEFVLVLLELVLGLFGFDLDFLLVFVFDQS